ncbi:MAG: DUF485 domain-containing protein [Solirubrobacterales bacterium]|nr:DUF485 domain-containing protein [Solirubrobacterales bacterium]
MIDWQRAEESSEFRELVTSRRRFVVPATIFFLAWFLAFILLAGYARNFMNERITGGLTVGYMLALTQFVMVWVLTFLYIRRAETVYDPLARRAAERAQEVVGEAAGPDTRLAVPGPDGDGAVAAPKPTR